MTASLDSIAKWFLSVGVHPVLGAFLAGAVIAFVFAYRRSPTVELSAEKAAMPSISTDGATRFSSSISGKVSIEGRTVEMSPEIMEHIRAGNKIEAIKALRSASGLDLKAAKDAVDAVADTPAMRR